MPKSYGHKSRDDTGKAHPSSIKPGIPLVGDKDGSHPGNGKPFGAAKSHIPKSARGGDGTANLGTKTVHKHGKQAGPKTSARDTRPSEVRVSDGLSVPRKIK